MLCSLAMLLNLKTFGAFDYGLTELKISLFQGLQENSLGYSFIYWFVFITFDSTALLILIPPEMLFMFRL